MGRISIKDKKSKEKCRLSILWNIIDGTLGCKINKRIINKGIHTIITFDEDIDRLLENESRKN